VAIYRLLQRQAFGPEDVTAICAAYENALVELKLERTDARTGPLAKRIIEIAQTGVRDPAMICELAIKEIGIP